MTDLYANCPKCGKKIGEYFHYVDSITGMGKPMPFGVYTLHCKTGYYNKESEDSYCGNIFKVRVGQSVEIET